MYYFDEGMDSCPFSSVCGKDFCFGRQDTMQQKVTILTSATALIK